MKIWHDDIRRPPDDSWTWARTNEQAAGLLSLNEVYIISLDYDLGLHEFDPDDEDAIFYKGPLPLGVELVEWMVKNDKVPPTVIIHSWNPPGAQKMAEILRSYGHHPIVEPFKVVKN